METHVLLLLLLLLAIAASMAAPQFLDAVTQPYLQDDLQDLQGLQEAPATQQPPFQDDNNAVNDAEDGDVELSLDPNNDGGDDYGWEALKGSVDVPLADVQWSLDQLPPSMRKVLRLVLFDKYRVNFT